MPERLTDEQVAAVTAPCSWRVSNPRPNGYEPPALTAELQEPKA